MSDERLQSLFDCVCLVNCLSGIVWQAPADRCIKGHQVKHGCQWDNCSR
jgi:hypothetical protein